MLSGGELFMMFEVGDAVVHPIRGAGVVTQIEELQRREGNKEYYRIKLVGQPRTSLMVPVSGARTRGLRHAIQQSRLGCVWRVLRAKAEQLPKNYRTRHAALEPKLRSGDLFQIAEVLRDLAWRRREDRLTTGDRRAYRKAMHFLVGEVAAVQHINVLDAEAQVRERLRRFVNMRAKRQQQDKPA
jgi:CarD family transcriptional regulator